MAAEKMAFDEFEKETQRLTGLEGHGWQKATASLLKISERAIMDAYKRGEAGPRMVKALRKAQEEAQEWTQLRGEAGIWAVALPQVRSRDKAVWCEVIVTHMKAPRFIAFFEFRTDDTVVRRVDQIDAAAPAELSDLVRAAEARAAERSRAELATLEAKFAREELVEAAAAATGGKKKDLADMSSIDLIALKERFTEESYEELLKQFRESLSAVNELHGTDEERSAFLRGLELGHLRLAGESAILLREYGGEAAEMAAKIKATYHARRLKRLGFPPKKDK